MNTVAVDGNLLSMMAAPLEGGILIKSDLNLK
jgi:hypothetical protein